MEPVVYTRTMAAYNRWMNERLYQHCATLSDALRKQDRGAFFGSIHGTLNHSLVGDRVWLSRFLGREFRVPSLATELYADFDELRRERELSDREITDWAAGHTPESLAGTLQYVSMINPKPRELPMWVAVVHFFNHQTHHRGQLTTLLSQAGIDPGVTDLMWLPDLYTAGESR
jgi:uncharacterized damage-inducible protein DinB